MQVVKNSLRHPGTSREAVIVRVEDFVSPIVVAARRCEVTQCGARFSSRLSAIIQRKLMTESAE
jgi:hypothetical protein